MALRYADHRYAILFYGLLTSLVLAPLVRPLGFDGRLVEVLLVANLVAAVLAIRRDVVRTTGLVVLGLAILGRVLGEAAGRPAYLQVSVGVWVVLALLTAAGALRFALRGQEVSAEKVHAALGAYLLAGFFFGQLYWVLEAVAPGSLTIGGAPAPHDMPVTTTIYFSFVTLASLGYGDVLPVSDPARGLAVAEVVSGQLYLAVLVARLVSAWR